MIKIPFEDGVKVSNAKVTIDGNDYNVTPAQYSGTTPLSAYNLNQMQDNIETAINEVDTGIGIWTNTRLTESFNAQTITIDDPGSKYKTFELFLLSDTVEAMNYSRAKKFSTGKVAIGSDDTQKHTGACTIFPTSTANLFVSRQITVYRKTVDNQPKLVLDFSKCSGWRVIDGAITIQSSTNGNLIPYRIFVY